MPFMSSNGAEKDCAEEKKFSFACYTYYLYDLIFIIFISYILIYYQRSRNLFC